MKIYTSSWFTRLPPEVLKIGISRAVPRGYPPGYRRMFDLAPGPWFHSVEPEEYRARFMAQLSRLDARRIVDKIEALAGGRDAALLCYEKPSDPAAWCHRGLVAAWFYDELGTEVAEYGLPGAGWQHPKLRPEWRARPSCSGP